MRSLILASRSSARLALLRQVGLNPKVVVSDGKELPFHAKGCAALVKHNALVKAKLVAKSQGDAVVIGADTVVFAAGKIIGKPKDKNDAFKTLKLLSRTPQWVYSGVAVIDVKSKQTLLAYEKTKVCMRRLTDAQIRHYVVSVGVEHLAGSFDIQGKGALFVERIEGCYYTVVGLPLIKLVNILEKLGVNVLGL